LPLEVPNMDTLLDAIAENESGGNPNALSKTGARGMYQIEPDTAKQFGVDNPDDLYDPHIGRDTAGKYVTHLYNYYNGDLGKTLAAYNTGPGHVDRGFIPRSTRGYVRRIMDTVNSSDAWVGFKPDDSASAAPAKSDPWAGFKPDPPGGAGPTFDTLSPEEAEVKRHAVEGGGTDMSDPLIENATVGILTAGLPTGLGFIPKTLAGKALNATAGTAEQYLYGWASEKAASAIPSGHPILSTAAALAAPIAVGGLESGTVSGLKSLVRLPAEQESAAKAAAEGAATDVYEKAPKQVYELGEKTTQAEEKATKATQGVETQTAEKGAKNLADQEKAIKAASAEAAPKLQQQQMEQFFGRTPAETEAARAMPSEDLALHRANMRKVVFGPINRTSQELGNQFNVASSGKLNNPIENVEPIAKTVSEESKWLNERGASLSSPVRDLMVKMPLGEALSTDTPEGTAQIHDILTKSGWTKKNFEDTTPTEQLQAARVNLKEQGAQHPTVGQLIGMRTEATKLVASQVDHNQVVAMRLRDAIDQTLMDSGLNVPQSLRERWGLYKSTFDKAFKRNVATAPNPLGYGKKLFENPERALAIVRGATPDEKQSLKQLAADYVFSTKDPLKRAKAIHSSVLKELFGDSPYAQIKPWLETDPKALAWEQFRAGTPRIAGLEQTGKQEALKEIQIEKAKDLRDAYVTLAEKLGPAGRGKLAKILAAKDPVTAAQIGAQEFPINAPGAQELYRQAQLTPGKRAFQANLQSQRLLGGLDVDAAKEDAAVKVLMNDQTSPYVQGLKRKLYGFHLPAALGEIGIGAALGTAGGIGGSYQLGFSGILLGLLGINKIREMFRPSLLDAAAATEYFRALQMRPSITNAKLFASRMTRAAIAAGLADYQKQNPQSDEDENQ
jgi:hypothetical protein